MDQFEELEKYKKLFDTGAISEEEFRRLKQQLLGLKSDEEKEAERQAQRNAALAEMERMKAAEAERKTAEEAAAQRTLAEKKAAEEEQRRQEEQAKIDEEKTKEDAQIAALAEAKRREHAAQIESAKKVSSKVASTALTIFLWVLTVFLLLASIGCFCTVDKGIFYIGSGIVFLLLATMSCPFISTKTRKIAQLQFYCKHKTIVVILLVVILLFLLQH